jgi:uncharacterized surface protein with fasciclin (FAS1) repeats
MLKSKIVMLGCLAASLSLTQVYAQSTTAESASSTSPATQSSKDIVETAAGNPDFSTLVSAVKAADLATTLSGPGPFTVFAPTNEAFSALPGGAVDDLMKPANKAKLASVLKYHVVPGKMMAADLQDGQTLKTVAGEELTVKKMGDKVMVGGAEVSQADVATSNGVIHVIGKVLMPGASMGNTGGASGNN